ncbi:MAG: outer membrane protein assembly factor BamB [Xanthomonadaceae bacterium]|nr:outer membrane protein assembly factor BamB [Xanthomonadaceae bacterium]
MNALRSGWVLLAALLMTGCSIFSQKDAERDPMELVEFDPSLQVQQLWSTSVGSGSGKSAPGFKPFYADGQVWVADYKGRVQAVDSESGRIVVRFDTEFKLSSGPVVIDDRVLVGTLNGQLVVIDRDDGHVIWRAQLSSEILASPIQRDGVIVVRCIDGRVFGLNAETGLRLWVYDRSVPLLTLRGNSDVAIRGGQIFIGHDDGTVTALNLANGNLLWEQRVSVPEGRTQLDRLADIDGPMSIVGLDLYVVTRHGRMASLALDSGRILWVKDLASHSGLSISRTQLVASDSRDVVWMIDRRSGATGWSNEQMLRRKLTRPVFHAGFVAVGDSLGYVHWLNPDTGEFVARERGSKDALTAPLVVGNMLYLLDTEGRLSAWRAGGAG